MVVRGIVGLVLAAVGLALVGVNLAAGGTPLVRSGVCVSWIGYDDEQAMFDAADLVVEGTVGDVVGQVDLFPGPGVLHEVVVGEVKKGRADQPTIRVAAQRDYCTADPPQPADPLHPGERVVLYLAEVAGTGAWQTLTPWDGVVPASSVG